jgi:selenide,water dikinase
MKMAMGSNVTIEIDAENVPLFESSFDLVEMGCIPGACFRNLEFVENDCSFKGSINYNLKMLLMDAQTSGGLLICCPEAKVDLILDSLVKAGYLKTAVIGQVKEKEQKFISVI